MAEGRSYGQEHRLTFVDRFGVWLSSRRIHREIHEFDGKRVADFGCGYDAAFVRTILDDVASVALVDVALSDGLKALPKVRAVEGVLPDALALFDDASFDVVLCTSVLEHLGQPTSTVREFHRLLAPGGALLLNVPSWRGKRFLEFSAFRLGLSPVDSVDDHKAYYDPRDLWPLLVQAGFRPKRIRCFRHKFGLNTFAVCRADP